MIDKEQLRQLVINVIGILEEAQDSEVDLTVGWSPEDNSWGWQTGDNSFTGGAYSHPLWAILTITHETEVNDTVDDIITQLDELDY